MLLHSACDCDSLILPVRLGLELTVVDGSQFGGLRADAFEPRDGKRNGVTYFKCYKHGTDFFQIFYHTFGCLIFNV